MAGRGRPVEVCARSAIGPDLRASALGTPAAGPLREQVGCPASLLATSRRAPAVPLDRATSPAHRRSIFPGLRPASGGSYRSSISWRQSLDLDGPCDPGSPPPGPCPRHRFPRSHGPSDKTNNAEKVKLRLPVRTPASMREPVKPGTAKTGRRLQIGPARDQQRRAGRVSPCRSRCAAVLFTAAPAAMPVGRTPASPSPSPPGRRRSRAPGR